MVPVSKTFPALARKYCDVAVRRRVDRLARRNRGSMSSRGRPEPERHRKNLRSRRNKTIKLPGPKGKESTKSHAKFKREALCGFRFDRTFCLCEGLSMSNGKRALLVLISGVVLALLLSMSFTREPSFHGVRLSEWINLQDAYKSRQSWTNFQELQVIFPLLTPVAGVLKPVDPREHEAEAAIQQIGPKALPCLIKWIGSRPNSWNVRLARTIIGT